MHCFFVRFAAVNLSNSNLNGILLNESYVHHATLQGASLIGADLRGCAFAHVSFNETDLSNALMGGTILADVELGKVKGLDSIIHHSPSYIDLYTAYRSIKELPVGFLRGIGTPETFIDYKNSLVGAHPKYNSCFISYSSGDQTFAERLYADLQSNGVRCWYAVDDLKIGERIRTRIDRSIGEHDKLLLVLSKHSVESEWVEQEVETALAHERQEKSNILFPVRLDDYVMEIDAGWPALIWNTRTIGDFRGWKSPELYRRSFDRLLRDLRAER